MIFNGTILKKIESRINFHLRDVEGFFPGMLTSSGFREAKKLRAGLFLSFAGEHRGDFIDIACAIELIQAASIIHDDVVDNAEKRRGGAALCRKYGAASGVLYGDYLLSRAYGILSGSGRLEVIKMVTEALSDMLEGELIEQRQRRNLALPMSEYMSIISRKSGAFFGLACRAGSLFRKVSEIDPDEACSFGTDLGRLYQLTDDYLDYFKDTEDKDRLSDLREGVITWPLIKLMGSCAVEERTKIAALFAGDDAARRQELVLDLMEKYGIKGEMLEELEHRSDDLSRYAASDMFRELTCCSAVGEWFERRIHDEKEKYYHSRGRFRGGNGAKVSQRT
jgi:octaprenyl-diphosphate synthase